MRKDFPVSIHLTIVSPPLAGNSASNQIISYHNVTTATTIVSITRTNIKRMYAFFLDNVEYLPEIETKWENTFLIIDMVFQNCTSFPWKGDGLT